MELHKHTKGKCHLTAAKEIEDNIAAAGKVGHDHFEVNELLEARWLGRRQVVGMPDLEDMSWELV